MAHAPEPPFAHDRPPRVGVLLVNLGTPDAPTPSAVRRYLAQFLSDPRVVEIPPCAVEADPARRRSCARGRRNRRRSTRRSGPRTARRCSCTACKQKTLLLGYLGQRLKDAGLAGGPVPGRARDALRQSGRRRGASTSCARRHCDRILVVPLYPQYAASTTASALDAVADASARTCGGCPRCASSRRFHDDPGYIKALAQNVNDYWMKHGRPGRARAVVPRPAAAHARPRRPVSLPLPDDRAPARARARPRRRRNGRLHVPVALRQRRSG